jgi:hypothetical protein
MTTHLLEKRTRLIVITLVAFMLLGLSVTGLTAMTNRSKTVAVLD